MPRDIPSARAPRPPAADRPPEAAASGAQTCPTRPLGGRDGDGSSPRRSGPRAGSVAREGALEALSSTSAARAGGGPARSLPVEVERITLKEMGDSALARSFADHAAQLGWGEGGAHATLLLPTPAQLFRKQVPLVAMGRACRLGTFGRIRRAFVGFAGPEGQLMGVKAVRLSDGRAQDEARGKNAKTRYTQPRQAVHELALLAAPFTSLTVRHVLKHQHHLYVFTDWLPYSLAGMMDHLDAADGASAQDTGRQLATLSQQRLHLALQTMSQIGGQLDDMHRHSWVHRDVKPDNVLARGGRELSLVLGDMGLALHLRQGLSVPRGFAGTPNHMSPEMVLGGGYSHSTDAYSLGAMLATTLAGDRLCAPPPRGTSLAEHAIDQARALTWWHGATFGGPTGPTPARLEGAVGRLRVLYAAAGAVDGELAAYVFRDTLDPDPARRASVAEIAAWGRRRLSQDPGGQLHVVRMMDSLEARHPDASATEVEISLLQGLHRNALSLLA